MGSLFNQFERVIEDNFRPNLNKHSYKIQGNTKILIPSYSYKTNLLRFAGTFTKGLKEQFAVRNIKDIKPEMVVGYLEGLKEKGYSKHTITQYKSYIRTFDKLIHQTYHFKAHLSDNISEVNGGREAIRTIYMKPQHLEMIFEYHRNKGTKSPCLLGLEIANLFGLRASEIVYLRAKDFDLNTKYLKVYRGKGNKRRFLKLNTEDKIEISCRIRKQFAEDDKIVPVRERTYIDFISDTLKALNILEYSQADTGNHAIRKKFAIEEELLLESQGMTKEEAIKEVSLELGHNRKNVTYGYIQSS